MANTDNARGLTPYNPQGGSPRIRKYKNSATTDTFRGDVVAVNASGVVHRIATTTGSAAIVGVAANFIDASGSTSQQDVWVYDDPNQLFLIQDDGDAATPAQTSVGSTFVLIVTAGSTTTGQSKFELDASATGVTSTDPLLVHGFITGPTLTIGKYANHIVGLNRHLFKKGSAGI